MVKLEAIKALKAVLGKGYSPNIDELSVPPDASFGDLAYGCFELAKGMKRNPAEVASEIAPKIATTGTIERVEARGPYVNFFLQQERFMKSVLTEIILAGESYGHHADGASKRVMVEYANPNTHKEIHIGHLRNFIVGKLAVNLLRAVGFDVIAASYINDLGNNVAKCLWAVKTLHPREKPEKGQEINFLGMAYAEATRAAEENPAVLAEISDIQKSLEEKKGEWHALWKETRKWSLAALFRAFKSFELKIDAQYYESDLLKKTDEIVDDLLKRGIAEVSDGAVIVNLEDEGAGVSLLKKTDGSLLYNAKDLALALSKQNDYSPSRSLIVVDVRQSLAMRQLFLTLKKMGIRIPYEHLSYGFISLPEGAMSSRSGNIVRLEEFEEGIIGEALRETKARHGKWADRKQKEVARAIARAAIVFAIAKQDPRKDMVFNPKEAISFEGASGPYLLYTLARISSMLKKSGVKPKNGHAAVKTKEAQMLVAVLAGYPERIRRAGLELDLSVPAQAAFDIAQAFASYYNAEVVIVEDDSDGTAARLALCEATRQVLENALTLIGIPIIHEM